MGKNRYVYEKSRELKKNVLKGIGIYMVDIDDR